jgi:hypothetical protein
MVVEAEFHPRTTELLLLHSTRIDERESLGACWRDCFQIKQRLFDRSSELRV